MGVHSDRQEPVSIPTAQAEMAVLDLFSGIGGFSLGLERAGFRTAAFCEIEDFPRRVLAKHWPEVPCYDDVRTLTAERLAADGVGPVDVICGGFPCQDISSAGTKSGLAGERSGLWSEIARLVGELRPRYVIVENVSALLDRGFSRVLGDLAALGYDAEWHCIPASYVGAPHARDRVWIVAYPNEGRQPGLTQRDREGPLVVLRHDDDRLALGQRRARDARSYVRRADHGLPDRSHRLAGLGNAVDPRIPELIGRAIMAAETPALARAA